VSLASPSTEPVSFVSTDRRRTAREAVDAWRAYQAAHEPVSSGFDREFDIADRGTYGHRH